MKSKEPKRYNRKLTKISTTLGKERRVSLKESLDKVREVKSVKYSNGHFGGRIYLPGILVGHKVKLTLLTEVKSNG